MRMRNFIHQNSRELLPELRELGAVDQGIIPEDMAGREGHI